MVKDFAVIVGLQYYPAIDDPLNGKPPLSGPENDAMDFKEWVIATDGGDVPEQNVKLILSSDYPPVPPLNFINAKPAETDVADAFEKLRQLSLTNLGRGLGSAVGRRLYIFMSGHGIAPAPFGYKIVKESALLMSNADPTNITAPRYHIPGTYTATWFCENDCFEEVFLFMDCCRDITIVPSPNLYLTPKGNSIGTKQFYAFATRWSRRSREKIFNGRMQGIFTKTLMMALKGACAEPDPANPLTGIITGASLKKYLYQNMKAFINPAFINDPQGDEPDIDYYPKANEGSDILIKSNMAIPLFPVIINFSAGVTGAFKIMDYRYVVVHNGVVPAAPLQITLNLPLGTYLLLYTSNGAAADTRFNITGIETVGNEAIVNLN